MTYIGIDYGSSMLKVASCESVEETPHVLNLAGHDPFIPAAIRFGENNNLIDVGWNAYGIRRSSMSQVAIGSRDRLQALGSSLNLGNTSLSAVEVQTGLLNFLKKATQSSIEQTAASVLAIPDHWLADRWSLPVALAETSWIPNLIVREWNAVSTFLEEESKRPLVMISAGGGTLRATLCIKREGTWERLVSVHEDAISGQELRKRLLDRVAERVVRATKRDPREDPKADQILADAVENALWELQRTSSTVIQASLFGQNFRDSLSREELARLVQSFRDPLENMLEQLLSHPAVNMQSATISVWGELASLLPIPEWLGRFCVPDRPMSILPLDAVAIGAARLAAWWDREQPVTTAEAFAGLCPRCGLFLPKLVQSVCSNCGSKLITMGERLEGIPHAQSKQPTATLTMTDKNGVQQRMVIEEHRFRLGRSPLSEWVFSDEDYPTVARAHAVIRWVGGSYLIRDLNSRNGTFVNDTRVNESTLNTGDEIRLGQNGPSLDVQIEKKKMSDVDSFLHT
jgi:FHA domain/Hsp70 protein